MDIFKIFGTIAVNNAAANTAIDDTKEKAEDAAKEIKDVGTQAGTAGTKLSGMISAGTIARATAFGNAIYNLSVKMGRLIISLGKDSIQAAAEVQAETAQFQAAFGDLQEAASETFNAIGKDTNIVSTRLRTVGTKAFSQLKGAGLEANDALQETDRYMRLAADAAAYYDISLEDADTRLRSFMRGNTEAGDAIGLFTSETQRDTYALEKYGAKWLDLNEAQRQMLMLDVAEDIYEQSGALGQAAREGHSWANVMANFSETWRQTLAKIGGPIMNKLLPKIEQLGAWIDANPEKIEAFATTVGDVFGSLLDGITTFVEWFGEHGDEVLATINNIVSALGSLFGFSDKKSITVEMQYQTAGQIAQGVTEANGSETLGALAGQNSLTWGQADTPAGMAGQWLGNIFSSWGKPADGSHANGLDSVPFDGYRAILHKKEAVLNARDAEAWRNGRGGGTTDTSRMEGLLQEMLGYLRDITGNTAAGTTITMDGRVVAGQIAPHIDAALGTLTNRKGRRN